MHSKAILGLVAGDVWLVGMEFMHTTLSACPQWGAIIFLFDAFSPVGRFEEPPAYHEYSYVENEPSRDYDYEGGYGADSYDDTPAYGYDSYDAPARRPRGGYRASRRRSGYNRPSRYNNRDYGYYDDEGDYYGDEEEAYSPRRGSRRGESKMDHYGRSGTYGYVSKPKHHVPVIIKKKKEKKRE